MKYLIIPDVHDKIELAERIIDHEPHDVRVYLGDFFDSFDDELLWKHDANERARRTAEFVKSELRDENVCCILGNHEACYFSPVHHACTGFTWGKHEIINSILRPEDWRRFTLHCWIEQGQWLVTHAGFHRRWLDGADKRDRYAIDAEITRQRDQLFNGDGKAPCLRHEESIIWCRHNRLVPPPGINQIYGHTEHIRPSGYKVGEARVANLDTGLRYYGVIENGELKYKEV